MSDTISPRTASVRLAGCGCPRSRPGVQIGRSLHRQPSRRRRRRRRAVSLGSHAFTVTARDQAGNVATKTGTYSVGLL